MKALELHIKGFKQAFTELGKGKYIQFFLPGLIIALIFWQLFLVTSAVENSFSFLTEIPFIGSIIEFIIGGAFDIVEFVLKQIFIFFVLTLLSPFNTLLSEKIDTSLTGKKYSFDIARLIADLIRMVFVVLLALFLEFIVFIFYFIVSSIFGLGFLDQIAYFLISAFFYGFAFYDYSFERDQINVFRSLGYAFSNMLQITLTGSVFLLIYALPYAGVIIAPVITTMVSTYVYIFKKQEQISPNNISND